MNTPTSRARGGRRFPFPLTTTRRRRRSPITVASPAKHATEQTMAQSAGLARSDWW